MSSKSVNTKKTYSGNLKYNAVTRYRTGESVKSICNDLEIHDTNRIYVWTKKYEEEGFNAFKDGRGKSTGSRKGRPKTKFNSLEEENAYLKAENELLKKKIARKWGGTN